MTRLPSSTKKTSAEPLAALVKAAPILAVLVVGLLSDVLRHGEATAGIEYGYALLALFTAAGCLGYLAWRISSRRIAQPSFVTTRLPHAASIVKSDAPGEDWPLLISLLFGPLLVLLAGLGGWV